MDLLAYSLLATIVGLVTFRLLVVRRTVFEFERGLLYRGGRFRRVLEPGLYWYSPLFTTIRSVDVRARFATVSGQEVLSSDSIALKVSLAAEYRVAEPARAVNEVLDFEQALYLELQLALRTVMGSATADEILERRDELNKLLLTAVVDKATALGLELRSVSIKDIMFPGELKKIFAQVVKAKKEGLAALERARGETAALRHLANAARVLDDNPALLHLRTLQTLGEGSGHTIVLGSAGAPFSVGRAAANGNGNASGNAD